MNRGLRVARAAIVLLWIPQFAPSGPGALQSGGGAQSSSKVQTLAEALDQADRLAEQRQTEEARKIYEDAAVRARDENNPLLESRALAGIGRILSFGAKYAEARQYLEQALALAELAGDDWGTARVANSLGIVAENLGQSKEALAWYEKSARSADAAHQPQTKAIALLNSSRLSAAGPETYDQLNRVIDIARSVGDKALEGNALHTWGERLFNQADFAAALEKYELAATLFEQAGDQDSLARVYTSMGRLERVHGQAEEAIPFYDKALQIQQKTGDKTGVIQSLNAVGVAYDSIEQYQQAREFYEKAYALALETKSPRIIDFMRGNLASNLVELGEYPRAAELLEEVLRNGTESYPGIRHSQLASAYLRMGRLAEAREHADQAVELSAQQPTSRPRPLLTRAEVRERQGDVPGALSDAKEAIRVIEEMRAKLVPLDFMKQGFSGYYQYSYSVLIELYSRLGQPEKALETAELARARAFLDLLATKELRLKKNDQSEVAELRRTEQQLRTQGINPDLVAAGPGERLAPGNLTAEAKSLLEKWRSARPEILSLVAASPQTATELAATARRLHSTILSYWTTADALYIWVVPPGGKVQLRRVEIPQRRLASLVDGVMKGTGGPATPGTAVRGTDGQLGIASSAVQWQELYRYLIEPVRTLLPPKGRLTIIPHGALMRLSFAALADEKGRYLLEDHALHYVPAGELLSYTATKKPAPQEERRYLLVADPQLPPPAKGELVLPALPGAREEVDSIARLLPRGTATVLQGPRADKQSVTASMGHAAVVHFATHGVTLDDRPLDSYLALGLSAESIGDGRLTAEELYAFDLHADLVVLSSCRSGGGKVTGDGVSALARAFFYAGAPSIIASIWNVPDQPASRLLSAFYASWLQGSSKVDALRTAQLRLLADLRAGRVTVHTPAGDLTLPETPLLWAGFLLLGEP